MEYSELRSLIVALLAFCVPIVAAIADKRTKAKKRSPQVNVEPIDFEELERRRAADSEGTRSIVRGPAATVPEPVEGQVPAVPELVEGKAARTFTVPEPVEGQPARTFAVPELVEGQVAEGAALRRSSATATAPKQAKEAQSGQYPTAEEIKKDCKKIILYSEILKPKFDERD
jgi:hypothetical protein